MGNKSYRIEEQFTQESEKDKLGKDDAAFEIHNRRVVYTKSSILCLFSNTCLRRGLVWFIEWAWFDRFIILLIFLNSIFMALYDYSDRENLTQRNQMVELTGYIFSGLFTVECILKILGMGFICHKNAYLRDAWNWIDFIVVIIGIIEIIPGIPNMKALRTLRVLRPLRSIKSIPSMRKLISSLLASLPALANVVIFLMFVFILFGILGVQQYVGAFYNRCRMTPQPVDGVWEIDTDIERICSKDGSGLFTCPEERYCGHPSEYPDILNLETEGVINQEEIFYGIVTFDNIGIGMITIFQIVTLEGWTDMMYDLMDNSQTEFSAIFFCLMVLIGSFFMLQLILAVIMGAFDQMENQIEQEKEEAMLERMEEQQVELNKQRQLEQLKEENKKTTEIEQQSKENIDIDNITSQNPTPIKKVQVIQDSIEKEVHQLGLDVSDQDNKGIPQIKSKPHTPHSQRIGQKSQSLKNVFDEMIQEETPQAEHEVEEQESLVKDTDYNELDDVALRAKNSKFLSFFYKLSIHPMFTLFVVILIIGNTITLALDRYPIDLDEYSNLELANQIFSWFFFAEMCIKLIGLGPVGYSRDRFNLFDCLIVIVSTVELVISWSGDGGGTGGAISAFRGVRLLRVFKLARSWKSFQEILRKILNSLKDISNFSVLLFLFIFIYALLGMELFAYRIKFDDNGLVDENGQSTRTNFDEFINAICTIFVVLIGEDWNNIMYQYVRASGTNLTIAFFMSWMILGNLVLLNLFLAILLKNFSEEVNLDDDNEAPEIRVGTLKKMFGKIKGIFSRKKKQQNASAILEQLDSSLGEIRNNLDIDNLNENNQNENGGGYQENLNENSDRRMLEDQPQEEPQPENNKNESLDPNSQRFNQVMKKNERQNSFNNNNNSISANSQLARDARKKSGIFLVSQKKLAQSMIDVQLTGRSLYILGPKNCLRKALLKVVSYKYFDSFILFMIIASTFLLTLENPLDDPDGELATYLKYIDIGVTSIFTIEMVLKILVLGFMFCGKTSYIRNSWNMLDFFIVTFSIISLSPIDVELKFIKVLRILRVLRPLRMISRNEGLKVAVLSLINAGPGILNVLVISLLFFLLFGILGVTYFKGEFFYCHMDNVLPSMQTSVETAFNCINVGGEWVNSDSSFDSIQESMMTLFEMSSTEGWIDVMWSGVDSVDIMYQPKKDNSFGWVFFFIGFIIIGSLFVLNLFVGVVIDTFNSEKEKLGKNFVLTDTQREWIQIQLLCFKSKPMQKIKLTGNAFRDWNVKIATSKYFDGFIIFCIILNTVVLALKFYDEPEELPKILEIVNYVFAGIFTVEAIVKLIALGGNYFRDGWNVFDFIIVIGTFAGIILTQTTNVSVGPQTTLIRAFRIGRIFRLIKKAKQLRMIFNTFVITIPSLANVGSLLVLLLYVYSVLGVFLFATIKEQETLNQHANFQNFGNAFLTLIRASTGEAWNYIMNDCARSRSVLFDCVDDPSYLQIQANEGIPNGCGTTFAYVYFVTFLLIVTFVFLNLFIAIILEGFNTVNEAEELRIPESTINEFREVWSEYDHNGNGFIQTNQLNSVIQDLVDEQSSILRYKQALKTKEGRDNFIKFLKIPCYKNFTQYHYLDVLHSLCKHNFSITFLKLKKEKAKLIHTMKQKEKDEIEADNFDQVIDMIENKFLSQKISVVESFRKVAFNHHKKTKKQLTTFEGNVFDSSHILLAPIIVRQAKAFLNSIREKKRSNQPSAISTNANTVIIGEGNSRLQKQQSMLKKGMSTDVDTMGGSSEDNRIKESPDVSTRYQQEPMNRIQEEAESVYSRQGSLDHQDRRMSNLKNMLNNNQNFEFNQNEESKNDLYLKAPFSPNIKARNKNDPTAVSKSQNISMPYSQIKEQSEELEHSDVNRIITNGTRIPKRGSMPGQVAEIDSPSIDNMLLEVDGQPQVLVDKNNFYDTQEHLARSLGSGSVVSEQASLVGKQVK